MSKHKYLIATELLLEKGKGIFSDKIADIALMYLEHDECALAAETMLEEIDERRLLDEHPELRPYVDGVKEYLAALNEAIEEKFGKQ